MARSWSFHSVALASGASPLEVEARDALVQRLAADPERASWQRASSYRVVGRPHLERAHIEHLAHLARLAKHAELEEAVRLTECTQLDYEERLVELVQVEDAACLAESARREAAARVAESVEQENAEHLAEPVQLDDADQSVGSVQLEDPELVTKRAQLEVAARLIESARLEHAARLAEYKQMTEGVESTGISSSESTTSEGSAPDAVVTPLALAFAFQRLIDQDKREFEQFVAESAAATELSGGDGSEAVSSPIEDAVGSCESPARIYLLLDYPSSVEEIDALLRLGELGNERTHATAQSSDELPLLPLIDGALLLADSLKGLQSRRKGSSIGSRRTSINPTKFDDLGTLDAFVPPSALPASSFVTANPSVAAFHEASSVGGLEWSDFVFTEVACTRIDHENTTPVQPKLADDLVREVVGTLERLAADKFAFKDWVQTTKVYSIPSSEPQSDSSQRLHRKYHQLLRPSFPASISVSTVVFALREAVARVADDEQNGGENGKQREEDGRDGLAASVDSNQEFIEYGDEAARRVARACACRDALRLKGNPVTMAAADGAGIAEVERVMWQMSDLPGVGNNGRKAFPIVSTLSPVERGVLETEFASFCPPTMSVPHVHLTRQLLQIEEVLGAMWKGKIQTREFAELLNARVFPQRLAQVLLRSPTVHKLYYPPTDALVLACISATAPGRFRTSFWSAREQVRHRPAFKDWKKERAMDPEYLTPRTAEAATACVPLSSTELEAVADKSWMFYPEDHSIVRLHQNPRGDTWLSVYQNRNMFGLRPLRRLQVIEEKLSSAPEVTHTMQFTASFDDESRLHVCEGLRRFPHKPDGFSTVSVTNTFPCGLSISAGSDGSIVQRYILCDLKVEAEQQHLGQDGCSNGRDHAKEDDTEDYRVLYGRGCVLRVFRDARGEILTPEGDVYPVSKHPDGSFQRTSPVRPIKSFAQSATTFTVDPETNALVERRASGVMIATHTDGARITYHMDGTRMYSNASSTHVLVRKHGFADVTIDINVNLTAQRHASGQRVAVTKGGLRSRSIVTVYDGTTIDVAYNTKVTAQVNGRVTTTKPDGTVVVAKDSGRIEYSPSDRETGGSSSVGRGITSPRRAEEDNDRDVVNHNGVYYFDIRLGRFELCDREQNVFLVETGDGSSAPRASVDLAGVVSESEAQKYNVEKIPAKATINDPIQPHVFILNGDGTALEVLTSREVADYITEVTASGALSVLNKDKQETPLQLPQQFLASLVVVHPWVNSEPTTPLFNDEALTSELMRLRRPVAAVGKHLTDFFAEFDTPRAQRFVLARRLWSLQPLSTQQVEQMQHAWDAWKRWQDEREANKDRFKVVDPRDAEAIAQEAAMQRRVLSAFKAARARKKLEQQKARELRMAATSKGAHVDSVAEDVAGEEERDGEPASDGDGEEGDDFEQFGSEESDDGTCDDGGTAVDDPMALLWTAFSQADDSSSGVLTTTQTLQALEHVLGTGVTVAELSTALSQRFQADPPIQVGFDLFVDLVDHFKRLQGEQGEDAKGDSHITAERVPRLRSPSAPVLRQAAVNVSASPPTSFDDASPGPFSPVAVGSGARAVWQRQAIIRD